MAEILGVIASGIAVAQVASAIVESIREIYSLTSEIKDAPKKLGDLLVEIEFLGEILVTMVIRVTQESQVNPAHFKILKHCETAIDATDVDPIADDDSEIDVDSKIVPRAWIRMRAWREHNSSQLATYAQTYVDGCLLKEFRAMNVTLGTDETIVNYMMEISTIFSESRRLKDGFPRCPDALYRLLSLLTDNLHDRRDIHTCTATISFISALLEMRVDVHRKDKFFGSPLSWVIQSDVYNDRSYSTVMENLPSLIMTWFGFLRKFDYDLQDYILQEWEYYQRCIIDPLGRWGFWYMHIFHARNTENISCKFECHKGSLMRRMLTCNCHFFWDIRCPHEPSFGKYNAETGKMDSCEHLEEESNGGCEDSCEDDDNNDGEGQKDKDVQEGNSESQCESDYYCCEHCGRGY
ncbi:predicted protein [Sclerotinia sclerotiorum 1980 UF-70]|uniref:NACHT-NTPase and P-loop NTPases N-terminal domain-containing protein n=1 Tax=Sclerotinia sclerotiorum (strain ATCC 18683 / 1980 / Ss-1) TaxID=665079 RepID=A7EUT3_SCLS1|nr:predicted protein [Sclerotinia sclerotiorum 1980 UF-70]EDN93225.1 predicted protein [Sclerotinia sclerotiorum 1980 UF-70]